MLLNPLTEVVMKIQEIMSQSIVACRPSDTLDVAANLMWEHDCGAILVLDHEKRLISILTDRDICMAAYTKGVALHAIGVSETMAQQIFSCNANDALDVAERLMSERQIRRLPIVDDDNHPVGVLSISDIALSAASSQKKNGLDRALAKTLGAICQPRLGAIHELATAQLPQ